MAMKRILVQAQHLKVGQQIAGLGNIPQIVTSSPSRGIDTPTGKVDLGVNGFRKTWNARTEIAILVEETENA